MLEVIVVLVYKLNMRKVWKSIHEENVNVFSMRALSHAGFI